MAAAPSTGASAAIGFNPTTSNIGPTPTYTEADLAAFADWGGYIGYRLGIYEDGDWSFFVAGD